MGIGTSVRSAVTSAINVIGSTVTITSFTIASDDGGYTGQEETETGTVTEKAIPFDELKKITKQQFGNLESASLQLAVKSTIVFDIQGTIRYKITFNGDVYDITEPKRFSIEDVLVAWILTLSKRLDQDDS